MTDHEMGALKCVLYEFIPAEKEMRGGRGTKPCLCSLPWHFLKPDLVLCLECIVRDLMFVFVGDMRNR